MSNVALSLKAVTQRIGHLYAATQGHFITRNRILKPNAEGMVRHAGRSLYRCGWCGTNRTMMTALDSTGTQGLD